MGNIITLLQEIFMMKEDTHSKIGLADFRENSIPVKKVSKTKTMPRELKISELMRKGSY